VEALVDRRWPRGVKRDSLQLAGWAREAAPSDEGRWFGHDPSCWKEFRRLAALPGQSGPAQRQTFFLNYVSDTFMVGHDELSTFAAKLHPPAAEHVTAAVSDALSGTASDLMTHLEAG
jgi:Protein of unknown function, DUF488